jgi:peptide-methionine (S)-S-oxide reductase
MEFGRFVAAASIAAAAFGVLPANAAAAESAIFAGGCFWCMEEAFDPVPGVLATTSGYTGGTVENPTYKQVTSEQTGHYEAVKVDYDPAKITYEQLLEAFWRNVDPFDPAGQFCDKGTSYKSVIFTGSDGEAQAAAAARQQVAERFQMPVATEVLPEKNLLSRRVSTRTITRRIPAQYNT